MDNIKDIEIIIATLFICLLIEARHVLQHNYLSWIRYGDKIFNFQSKNIIEILTYSPAKYRYVRT